MEHLLQENLILRDKEYYQNRRKFLSVFFFIIDLTPVLYGSNPYGL